MGSGFFQFPHVNFDIFFKILMKREMLKFFILKMKVWAEDDRLFFQNAKVKVDFEINNLCFDFTIAIQIPNPTMDIGKK